MKSDPELKHDVERELAWDHRIDAPAIGVSVHGGVITLTGTVSSWSEKHLIEQAVYRVPHVRDLANDVEIRPSWDSRVTDGELAAAIRGAFEHAALASNERIRISVCDHGSVTLSGDVTTLHEREVAEQIARYVPGAKFVTNELGISEFAATPTELRETIEDALAKHAARAAAHVKVAVDGDTVVLEGVVASWLERRAVLGAARGIPGVRRVEDHLFFI
ncbi:MAG: BON domain-containing protein [Kofleriaceae bacterium]